MAPSGGTTREALRLVEVEASDEAQAIAEMAANVATLVVIGDHLWTPAVPPLWVADGRGDPTMELHVPGLDDGRVRDLVSFVETGRGLYHSDTPSRCLPWTVPVADAARILGCGDDLPDVTVERHGWDLPEGGMDAYRALLLADDVDSLMSHAQWFRMDSFTRMTMARTSGEARLAACGSMSTSEAMNRAGQDLLACAERYRARGLGGRWQLLDFAVERMEIWAATKVAEVAWANDALRSLLDETDEELEDVRLGGP